MLPAVLHTGEGGGVGEECRRSREEGRRGMERRKEELREELVRKENGGTMEGRGREEREQGSEVEKKER